MVANFYVAKLKGRFWILAVLVAAMLSTAVQPSALADDLGKKNNSRAKERQDSLPEDVSNALNALLACKDPSKPVPSNSDLSPLLDYMTGGGADYNNRLADRPEGTGFYWRDSIKLSFENALFYLFNPGVPSEVVYPSSIRAGNWLPGSDILKLDRPLSACLASLDERVVLRGTEAEEITPDTFSGSYYAYKLDRLLILLKHNDKPLLISVSWQKGKSDIGKKSGFIGDYDNWDFVYTKENGATKTGIGWADTYMYASCSVTLYFPDGPNNERTGYAVYRWLKAGWSGINMVEKQHLKDGMLRTLGGMKCVLESARRPDHKELSEKYRQLSAKSIEELSGLAAPYVQALQKNGADLDSDVEEVLKTGDYAGTLTKRQLVGMLMLNYVKEKLGKPVLE